MALRGALSRLDCGCMGRHQRAVGALMDALLGAKELLHLLKPHLQS